MYIHLFTVAIPIYYTIIFGEMLTLLFMKRVRKVKIQSLKHVQHF